MSSKAGLTMMKRPGGRPRLSLIATCYRVQRQERLTLVRYMRTVDVSFDPFDCESRSLKEVWRQMSSRRLVEANPKVSINLKMGKGLPAKLQVGYVDGKVYDADAEDLVSVRNMISTLFFHAHKTELAFAMENKPPP